MTTKVFIHAANVHQGGGRSLLDALLKSFNGAVILLVDERMHLPVDMSKNIHVKRVKPSIVQRLLAERWLAENVASEDVVLCFGNLPPLFKLHGYTEVFLQNRYLIENVSLSGFSFKVHLRLVVERLWLSWMMKNVDAFIVQTPTMKRLLESKMQLKVPVRVFPFVADPNGYVRDLTQLKVRKDIVFDFVYVASGEPHKNHRRLIEAWCLLAEEGVFPSLTLTLSEDRFTGLCRDIDELRQRHKLQVKNVGELFHKDVFALYKNAGAAIYPSTFESFGLPLIEARQAGLPILASELDYVRDVINPEHTFDPESVVSIARAVMRFMGKDEVPLPLLDACRFMASVVERAE